MEMARAPREALIEKEINSAVLGQGPFRSTLE